MPRNDGEQDKGNDNIQSMKQNHEVMNQIYKNFYALYTDDWRHRYFWQEHISCEMIVEKEVIKFNLAIPKDHLETFEKHISSFYPGCVIDTIPQPKLLKAGMYAAGGNFLLTKGNAFPLKTYENFEVDPMDSVLSSFARVGFEETLCFQILMSPLNEKRQKKMRQEVEEIKEGKSHFSLFGFLGDMMGEFFKPGKKDDEPTKKSDEKKHDYSSGQLWDIEKKVEDEWFEVIIRGLAVSPDPSRPEKLINDLFRSLNQYNYIGLNAIKYQPCSDMTGFLKAFAQRLFIRPDQGIKEYIKGKQPMILNIKELASIFHFPHGRFNKNPRIRWQKYKIVAAPDNIPTEGVFIGTNLYWWVKKSIRIEHNDRFRHFYIIGQTGTGKSSIMTTMMIQDLQAGNSFTLIDPHGDLAEGILKWFPKERIDDLIYFDGGNTDYPLGINVLAIKDEKEQDLITNDLVAMFVKLYGEEIFGPRIQDYFRNAVLLLMEQPDWGTLVEIVRLFTDPAFQKIKLKNVKNPVIRARREKTYGAMWDKEKQEMIPYFQSKFGPLTTTPVLRNIIGQPESSFDVASAMNDGKFIIINLSKGKMGEINSNLLGLLMVGQVKLAAFRRAEQAEHDRRDHFMYIDEFQNFVTPDIESILSEARKYRLGLVLAHQYMKQLHSEGLGGWTDLRGPILGNVGNMVAYRIGIEDADDLTKQFAPAFSTSDLTNLDAFQAAVKLSVKNQPTVPFSVDIKRYWEYPVLNAPEKVEIIKQICALKYGRKKELVEKEIFYRVWV
jgi:Helicase HerA, central domain